MNGKAPYIVIIILAFVVGYLIAKLIDKRNSNIIKLLFKRDLLPAPAPETKWIQGGICWMGDGTIGKVNGLYCEQLKVM